MTRYLLVAVFGAAGAMSRYAIDGWVGTWSRGQFPWGTLTVNLIGSFLLGVVIEMTTGRLLPHTNWRLALGMGFLASFTTFSTYTYETIRLAEDAAWGLAMLNVALMTTAGMLAAFAGLALGRAL